LTSKKREIKPVKVKYFVATTQFEAVKDHASGMNASFTLEEGLDLTLKKRVYQQRCEEDEVLYTE
jgi:hypothetical protein